MKRHNKSALALIAIALSVVVNGCVSVHTELSDAYFEVFDLTKGAPKECAVHTRKMQAAWVPYRNTAITAAPAWYADYSNASAEAFPNGSYILRDVGVHSFPFKNYRVYNCSECCKAEKTWFSKHPEIARTE
jgi:hypothetical protein